MVCVVFLGYLDWFVVWLDYEVEWFADCAFGVSGWCIPRVCRVLV